MRRYFNEACWFGVGFALLPAGGQTIEGHWLTAWTILILFLLAVWYWNGTGTALNRFWYGPELLWFLNGMMTMSLIKNLATGNYFWAVLNVFFIWLNLNASRGMR